MTKSLLSRVLIALFLTSAPSFSQSLYDVVVSLSDRQRVVNQKGEVAAVLTNQNNDTEDPDLPIPDDNPIDWLGIGDTPTQSAVDGMNLSGKISLLNQAVAEFERLKFEFLNSSPAEFQKGGTVGILKRYRSGDFDPLPRATPENYNELLRLLAQRVRALRLIEWSASFQNKSVNDESSVREVLVDSGGQSIVEIHNTHDNSVVGITWKPNSIGPGNLNVSTDTSTFTTGIGEASLSCIGRYEENTPTEQIPLLREQNYGINVSYPEKATVSATAQGAEGIQIDGSVYVLRRSHWNQIQVAGTPTQFDINQAGYFVEDGMSSGDIPLFTTDPTGTFSGSWDGPDSSALLFVEGGYQHREIGENLTFSGIYYENNWRVGCTFPVVFKPTFTHGVDAPGMQTKLEYSDSILASNNAEGNLLLRPRSRLLFGIDLGPGLKGSGRGYISTNTMDLSWYTDYWNFWLDSPYALYDFSNQLNMTRFDSSYTLGLAGSCSDYHVVYQNDRSQRTQSLPADGIGWPYTEASSNQALHDTSVLYGAWDSPRLTQVAGRDLVANIEYNSSHYGGYKVKIYRRPIDSPAPTPGQAMPVTGMTLIHTWEFSHPNIGTTAHPTDCEKLEVQDTASGSSGAKYEIMANEVLPNQGLGRDATWFYGYTYYSHQPWIDGTHSWTFKLSQGTAEKLKEEIVLDYAGGEDGYGPIEWDLVVSSTLDGQLVSSLSSSTLDPFSDKLPADWEIVSDGKTISGTATLGDANDRAYGYGKWPSAISIQYDGIQPDAAYTWDSNGLLSSATQGQWAVTGAVADNAYVITNKFNGTTYSKSWIEFLNGGNKVKSYSAPDGNTTSKTDSKVAWSEIEYGTATTGLPGLPLKLSSIDGSGTKWTWAPEVDQSGTLTLESGLFTGNNITTGTRQTSSWNTRGHTTESETEMIANGTVSIASSAVPTGQFTAWGVPKEWKNLYSETSTLISYSGGLSRLDSVTSPLGMTTAYSNYDALGRPGQIVSNGITATNTFTGLGLSTTYGGAGVAAGSQSSFTQNAIGTTSSSDLTWGGVNQTHETERGASNTTITSSNSLIGSSQATMRNDDGSLSAANGSTLAYGGVSGDALSIVNGLFVTKTAVAEVTGTFAETHTDAWGRTHKIVTPSKSSGTAQTTFSYSMPDETLKRVITTDPSGRVFISESDTEEMISRSGIDVNGNGALGASDRYTESITEVSSGKIITTLSVTEDSGMREVLRSEVTPDTGVTVTKINGNEETITTTPNYSAKTVTTASSKGWSRTTGVNSLGLSTSNTLSGTGIPTTSLTPTWRADGSLQNVSLTIGGETHSASFNENGTLATLTAPGRGNILGGHTISNGVESLTVNGKTTERKLDGTEKSTSGGNVIGKSEVLSKSGNGYKNTVTPAVGAATETAYNTAFATTAKTYADSSGETLGYSSELLSSISLARGGALVLAYSNDGAKDLTAATWPAIASGPFTIPAIGHGYEYNRSGQIKTHTDPSGTRSLTYFKGRMNGSLYTAGVLKGYQVIPGRDEFGRQTGTLLKRDGNTIHTTAKAPNGASDQVTNLASGNITATPQRNAAGNITGYIWSDGTNTVTQTWARGAGARIEEASSNVPNAPSFNYAANENSFDAFGRRLKCETAGGTWTYTYGVGGQITSATHPTLGTFNYAFDGIGRRTDKGTANTTDILNRTTAWTHNQNKTLTINANPDARVWFNGVEIENFNGTYEAAITSPGTNGGWVPWETLAIIEDAGEGAGNPAANPLADPDAKSEKRGAVWVPPAAETFTFDAAGNRLSSALWEYGWDAKNQLARARTKNHTTAAQAYDLTYTYDSEGRRIKKHVIEYQNGAVVSEKIITFIWDGWDLLYERHQLPSGLTTLERKYLWGPDIADGAAGGAGGLLLIKETKGNATTNLIPLYDGTGHLVALTDINKNLLASYQFGPFGEKISATGTHAQSNPWRFQTKYLDEETGLYYYGHRFYDPITGQFLSRDKLGEDEDLHLYRITGNDPINFVDRFGLAQVATDGRGELTTFGQALMTIAKDDPDAARKILLAAQVNREISEANIDSLVGDGDGDSINSVVSAIDLAVGTARSDGRKEWKDIDLQIRDGGGSRLCDFDNGRPTQKIWKDAYLAEYLPVLASSAAHAAQNKALQSAAIQKEQAIRNTSVFRLKQMGQATADLPMHLGAFAFSAAFATDVTTGSAVTWNGWGNGFGLAEVTTGERAVAGALLLAGPLGRAESIGDDLVRTGMRGRSFAGTASRPWAVNRVGSSELGNALSGLGRNPVGRNLNTLDEFGSGAGFSGVYDVGSGKFLAYPSGGTKLANGGTPLNLVDQFGGHRDVNQALSSLLGNSSNNRLGFSMTLDDAGNFGVGWNSRTINAANPAFPGHAVPDAMRQQVLDAIMHFTGRTAH